ncbi:hypothetical protein EVAR_86467_1 [Eumeta japonica]|uniref:115 kDa protein in type-1 retrotransposable element R1DM n=1 Tax=Eumeta variegata TaxID=151549 RepID=A0A4C1VNS9_EUMVA|nr:hypothetical protein EVAR_86467_1 [Eumeta japonica]
MRNPHRAYQTTLRLRQSQNLWQPPFQGSLGRKPDLKQGDGYYCGRAQKIQEPVSDSELLLCRRFDKNRGATLEMCRTKLKVANPEMRLPTIVIRDVLKMNSVEDVKPYVGNIGELRRHPRCRVVQTAFPRRKPVNAAIIILDSDVDVEENYTPIDKNVTAAVIKAENCSIDVVSVYFERNMSIGSYLDRMRHVCTKLGTIKIILEGDVNAWSVRAETLCHKRQVQEYGNGKIASISLAEARGDGGGRRKYSDMSGWRLAAPARPSPVRECAIYKTRL